MRCSLCCVCMAVSDDAADGARLAVFGGELLDHLHVGVEIGDGAGHQAALLGGAARALDKDQAPS